MHKIGKTIIYWLVIVACIRVCCRSPNFDQRKYPPRNEMQQKMQQENDSRRGSVFDSLPTEADYYRERSKNRRESGSGLYHNDFYQNIRQNLLSRLDYEERGLAIAYLLGDKNELTNVTKEKIQEVGVSHLIAISGMHLVILVGIVIKSLKASSKLLKTYFCVAFVLLYVGMIGLTPSLLRATIVIFCHLFASYFGRKVSASRILVVVASLSLIINPDNLTNVGWQLSMMAYTGILIFYPMIESFLFGKGNIERSVGRKNKNSIWQKICRKKREDIIFDLRTGVLMSLAVNLLTIPITLFVFGYFSILSFLATLILSPMLPVILVSIIFVGIMPLTLYRYVGVYFVGGVGLIKIQLRIINLISDWQYFAIHVPKGKVEYLLLYLPVLYLYFFLRKKNIQIAKNNTSEQDESIERRNEMQKIGTYLVEWEKQLQLRCKNQKNYSSVAEAPNNMKNGG